MARPGIAWSIHKHVLVRQGIITSAARHRGGPGQFGGTP